MSSISGPAANTWFQAKVIRDIVLGATVLRQNMSKAGFDFELILAMEYCESNKAMHEICGSMEKLQDVIIAKTNAEDAEVFDSIEMAWACVPNSSKEESLRILAAYKRSLEGRQGFNFRCGTMRRRCSIE
jgi:hypothetical protein